MRTLQNLFGLKSETRDPAVLFSNRFSDLLSSTAIATARPTLLEGEALSQEVESISFRFSDLLKNRNTSWLRLGRCADRESSACVRRHLPT